VAFHEQADQVEIHAGEIHAASYVLRDAKIPRPYFAHLRAPNGIQVTRNHPPQAGDRQDHPLFHPGLWMAFGDLSGNDCWRLKARVVHDGYLSPPRGEPGRGGFTARHLYLSEGGTETIAVEEFRFELTVHPDVFLIEWTSTFRPLNKDIVFGDQEEMGLGVRVATPISVEGNAGGMLVDSEGRAGGKAIWGRRAAWCHMSGMIDSKPVGVLLMPDPRNVRPSRWHARDYGFVAANPFSEKAFTGGQVHHVRVARGESLTLRFGIALCGARNGSAYDPLEIYNRFLTTN
jgi:hypothetical protein